MKTEIIKIIEAGLAGDKTRVMNYANTLAKNVKDDGDTKFYNRIINLITHKNYNFVNVEEFQSKPVDQDSRMDIVDVIFPNEINIDGLYYGEMTINELNELISEYRKRDVLLENGITINNSLMLYGRPGCGKTTMAKFIAKQLNLPIIVARLDTLVSSLLGNTSKNLRKVFEYAKQRECILFLDEFDVLAKARDDKNELGELKRVVNSLLQNIDDFLKTGNFLIAATNHHELLDVAVWRRFSKIYEIKPQNNVEKLIERNINFKHLVINDTEKKKLFSLLRNYTPSDITTIINNAAKKMFTYELTDITYSDLLKEIFIFEKHSVNDEDDLIKYYIYNGCSINDLYKRYNYSLRTLRELSKEVRSGK